MSFKKLSKRFKPFPEIFGPPPEILFPLKMIRVNSALKISKI